MRETDQGRASPSTVDMSQPPSHRDPDLDSMPFRSILFGGVGINAEVEDQAAPEFFRDLNLDQVVAGITESWEDYNLTPFFYARLSDLDAIGYRQEIMGDFSDSRLTQAVHLFAAAMRAMRERLKRATELYYKYAMERAFLGAAEIYWQAAQELSSELTALDLHSRGLRAFRKYLTEYVNSSSFRKLVVDGQRVITDLSNISYSLLMKDDSITVRHDDGENDYSTTVEETFAKFWRQKDNDHGAKVPVPDSMNHIQAQILERLALLFADIFRSLEEFSTTRRDFQDDVLVRFDREIQFYVSYLKYADKLKADGLRFCLPVLSRTSKEVSGRNTFDIALAQKLVAEKGSVVTNDFFLSGPERIFVVSGPNQGGKTTFARTFGQLHYLASLGCPVPGTQARLFLYDNMFAHFEREETITNLRGKLHDDLVRIRTILDHATPNSIVIMNEIFSSTTLRDAVFLSKKVMAKMDAIGLLGVWVTFLDELASFSEKTVSIVSIVDPHDLAVRTFKLERRSADGLAYAHAIAEKHRVTYGRLKERIKA